MCLPRGPSTKQRLWTRDSAQASSAAEIPGENAWKRDGARQLRQRKLCRIIPMPCLTSRGWHVTWSKPGARYRRTRQLGAPVEGFDYGHGQEAVDNTCGEETWSRQRASLHQGVSVQVASGRKKAPEAPWGLVRWPWRIYPQMHAMVGRQWSHMAH